MRRRSNRKHKHHVDFAPLVVMCIFLFAYFMHGVSSERIKHAHELNLQTYGVVK